MGGGRPGGHALCYTIDYILNIFMDESEGMTRRVGGKDCFSASTNCVGSGHRLAYFRP